MPTMKRFFLLLLCLILTVPALAQNAPLHADFEYFEKLGTLIQASTESAAPSLVSIRITRAAPARGARQPRASEEAGSGIAATIADKKVILTNRHVIEEAERGTIEILTHDRRHLTLVKTVSNEEYDLAVLEVAEELPRSARFGNSDKVYVGEVVLALGNPFGLDRSVSMGVISAVGRRQVPGTAGSAPRTGFFQTDAAINPGSSGGMLLNVRGEIIGLITAIATQGGGNEGVAFAMPINPVLRIAEQLVQSETVLKPHIGFGFESVISLEERRRLKIDRKIGAKIRSVEAGSPADRAGLKTGDVITMFGEIEVEDGLHIIHLVAQSEIDKPIVLQINRNAEIQNITVTPIAQLSR